MNFELVFPNHNFPIDMKNFRLLRGSRTRVSIANKPKIEGLFECPHLSKSRSQSVFLCMYISLGRWAENVMPILRMKNVYIIFVVIKIQCKFLKKFYECICFLVTVSDCLNFHILSLSKQSFLWLVKTTKNCFLFDHFPAINLRTFESFKVRISC